MKYYKEAEKRIKKILGNCHLNVANLLSNMGVTYFNCEKYEESLSCHKEAYEINSKILGQTHSLIANSLDNIACVLSKNGKAKEAVIFIKKTLKIFFLVFNLSKIPLN